MSDFDHDPSNEIKTPDPDAPFFPNPTGPAAESHKILASMLMPGEHVLRHVTISTGIYWKGLAVLMIALLVMLLVAFKLGLYLIAVSLIMLGIAYMTQHFLLLAATNKRVIMRGGIINLDVIQLRYSKIESVELAWTIVGQFLGYASVVITGTGSRVVVIPYVRDAVAFRQAMNEQLLAREATVDE